MGSAGEDDDAAVSRARCLAAILALATASPSAATAQTEASYFTNGNDLLADCADTTTATVSGCYAYLAGFVDGSLTARARSACFACREEPLFGNCET